MELPYSAPNVLRLTGVSLRDHKTIEAQLKQRLKARARADVNRAPAQVFDTLPAVFTGADSWPTSTNILCWECGGGIDGPPRFQPSFVRGDEKGGLEMGVGAILCSFPCAALRVETRLGGRGDEVLRWRALDLLNIEFFMFTGRTLSVPIPVAPERTRLRQYGGDLDEGSFREKIRSLDPATAPPAHGRTAEVVVPASRRAAYALAMEALKGGARRPGDGGGAPSRHAGRAGGLDTKGTMWEACESAGPTAESAPLPAEPRSPPARAAETALGSSAEHGSEEGPAPAEAAPKATASGLCDRRDEPPMGRASLAEPSREPAPAPAPEPDAERSGAEQADDLESLFA